jgi:hypothetical protein
MPPRHTQISKKSNAIALRSIQFRLRTDPNPVLCQRTIKPQLAVEQNRRPLSKVSSIMRNALYRTSQDSRPNDPAIVTRRQYHLRPRVRAEFGFHDGV